jgi:cold shock CspA family protein
MDSILNSFIDDFKSDFSFEAEDLPKVFEHFVNYCVVNKIDPDRNAIENVNVGSGGNPGIDGIAIIVNDHVVISKEQVDYFLEALGRLDVEFIFIQSKTSEKFEMAEINNFLTSVHEFFQSDSTIKFSDEVLNLRDLKDYIYSKSIKFEENPNLKLYYASCGQWCDDSNIKSIVDKNISGFKATSLFKNIRFYPIDKEKIKILYKEIKMAITKEFSFDKHTILPQISNISESFIGIVTGKEFLKLITDENGDLLRNIFYDNVRDFQGFNSVNSEIKDTIEHNDKRDKFVLLNNGITIVAKKLNKVGCKFKISDYQVVNGCQTSHVIYYLKNNIDENMNIPIKIIVTDNYDVTSQIIKATNRQTEVKSEAFEILSPFHKKLEEFYAAIAKKTGHRLLYERRSHQYDGLDIKKTYIITLSNQVTSYVSMYLNEPHSTLRYFGELLKSYKSKLFVDEHHPYPYYISGLALSRLEWLFRLGLIDNKLKRFKYHMLMNLRQKACGDSIPKMNSKELQKHCDTIQEILLSDEKCKKYFQEIEKYIANKVSCSLLLKRNMNTLRAFTEEINIIKTNNINEGNVVYYNSERGFGFININGPNDVFFHIRDYRKKFEKEPQLNELLSFDIIDSENGLRAINIDCK